MILGADSEKSQMTMSSPLATAKCGRFESPMNAIALTMTGGALAAELAKEICATESGRRDP
jgi:hypothetical protein